MARAKAAMPASRGSASRGSAKRGSWVWLQGLVCGAVVTMATPTALLVGVLLAPAVLAFVLDRAPGRAVARPVILLGLATSVHPLLLLWRSGHGMEAATGLATDPAVIVLAWAAQAAGWLLVELLPVAIGLVMQGGASARAARLRGVRRTYEEDWDIPPRVDAEH